MPTYRLFSLANHRPGLLRGRTTQGLSLTLPISTPLPTPELSRNGQDRRQWAEASRTAIVRNRTKGIVILTRPQRKWQIWMDLTRMVLIPACVYCSSSYFPCLTEPFLQHWDSSPGSSSLSYHSDTGSIPHGQPVSFLMHASMRPSFFVEHQRPHEAPKCINLDQLLGAGTEAEAAEAEFAGPLRSKRPSTVSNPGTEAPVEYIIEDEDADAEGEDEIPISEDVDAERDEGRWSSVSISHTPSELSEYRPSASPPAEDIHTKNSSPSGRYHPYSTIGRKSRVKNDSSSSSTSSETRTTRKRTVSSERDRSTSNVGVPIPVPNLTKKSRGRKVPTAFNSQNLDSPAQSDEEYPSNGSVRRGRGRGRARKTGPSSARRDTNRTYRCEVEECGKCFVRGEHLKRHIRSIHTNEKRERFVVLLLQDTRAK